MKHISFLFTLLFVFEASSQKNLVLNGSFENELQYWRGDVAKINPFDKKAGKNSCIITQFTGKEWKGIDQIISVPKNTVAIECSGWIKNDEIEKGDNPWNTGKYDIEFLTSGEKNIKNESIASILGTTSWTFYKKTFVLPEKCTKFRLILALGQTNGTILFDDIKATVLNQEEYNKITEAENAARMPKVITDSDKSKLIILSNGDFENDKNDWRGQFDLTNTFAKEGKTACMITSNEPVWKGIDQVADIPENAVSITVSGWLKSDNIVQGKDGWNNGLLNVEFTSNGTDKTGNDQSITFVTGTTDWAFYTKTFPLPKGTKKYRIMIALGFATGTLFADEISVNFN